MRDIVIVLSIFLTGCGPMSLFENPDPNAMEFSMEGVKLIAREIPNGNESTTFLQESYSLGRERRLMVRFEKLTERMYSIKLDDTNKVELKIRIVAGSDPAEARANLQVCPLKRPWMMLATWDYAHPFDHTGRWQTQGGDYDPSECVSARSISADEPIDPETLIFDVSDWFRNYPRGRGENQGLLLKSDSELSVFGDRSGMYSPRLLWNESPSAVW